VNTSIRRLKTFSDRETQNPTRFVTKEERKDYNEIKKDIKAKKTI
jgi:hypothetical protein